MIAAADRLAYRLCCKDWETGLFEFLESSFTAISESRFLTKMNLCNRARFHGLRHDPPVFCLVSGSRCPASTASGQFLRRPAMAFGELYEFLEVVLSFARPQEAICSKEVHVSHLHHLHAWRPEAGRNK